MDRQLSGEGIISLKGNDLGGGGNHPGSNFQGWRDIFLGSNCPRTANKVLLKEIRIPIGLSLSPTYKGPKYFFEIEKVLDREKIAKV